MLPPMDTDLFARTLARVDAELDWEALGTRVYCAEGGEDFFAPERRDAMHEAGLAFAADLAEHLPTGGRSAHVGAGGAELAPIPFERVVPEREGRWPTPAPARLPWGAGC